MRLTYCIAISMHTITYAPKKLRLCPPWCGMCLLHAPRGAENTALYASDWLNPCWMTRVLRIKATGFTTVVAAKLVRPFASLASRLFQHAGSLQNLLGHFGQWLLMVGCRRGLLASQPTPCQPWGRWSDFWLWLFCVLHVLIAHLGYGRSWHVHNALRLAFCQFCILCQRSRRVPNEAICVVHLRLLGLQFAELFFQVGQKVVHVELLIAVLRFGVCAFAILHSNWRFLCFIRFWPRTFRLLQAAHKKRDICILVLLWVRFLALSCQNVVIEYVGQK